MTNIEDYVGVWVARRREEPRMSESRKDDYYPPEGDAKIEFFLVEHQSLGQDPITKTALRFKVLEGVWAGGQLLEKAVFFFYNGMLVSAPVTTQVAAANGEPLSISEIVTLNDEGQMDHEILWEDGDIGRWGCGPA